MGRVTELKKQMEKLEAEMKAETDATLIEIGTLYCALSRTEKPQEINAIKSLIAQRAHDLDGIIELTPALKKEVTKLAKAAQKNQSSGSSVGGGVGGGGVV